MQGSLDLQLLERKPSLKELFRIATWIEVFPKVTRHQSKTIKNSVSVSYQKVKYKNGDYGFRINFRIGCVILKELGWKAKDKIMIFQNDDDPFLFKLMKSESEAGFTLKRSSNNCCVSFKWSSNVPLKPKNGFIVDHEIFNENILGFRAKD